jgi:hypothetical protein
MKMNLGYIYATCKPYAEKAPNQSLRLKDPPDHHYEAFPYEIYLAMKATYRIFMKIAYMIRLSN